MKTIAGTTPWSQPFTSRNRSEVIVNSSLVLDGKLIVLRRAGAYGTEQGGSLCDAYGAVLRGNPAQPAWSHKFGPMGIAYVTGLNGSATPVWVSLAEVASAAAGNPTGIYLLTAPKPFGPWTPQGWAVPVPSTGWQVAGTPEVSCTCLLYKSGRLYILGHGGGNGDPATAIRQGYAAVNNDNTLTSWSESPVSPVIPYGSGADFDAIQASDLSGVKALDGTYVVIYKARDDATGLVHTVGIATGTNLFNLTKSTANPVIDVGGVGTWNEYGEQTGAMWRDAGGRIHLWIGSVDATNVGTVGAGYFYSDDNGANWIAGSNNPVGVPGTDATKNADYSGGWETLSFADLGDVIGLDVHCGNFDAGYLGSIKPLRAKEFAVLPKPSTAPTRAAYFATLETGASWSGMDCTAAPLKTMTAWSICARVKAYPVGDYCHLFTIGPDAGVFENYKHTMYLRVANTGVFEGNFRTPSALVNITGTTKVDSADIYDVMFVRNSTNSFQLWVRPEGGSWAMEGSSALNPGTTSVLDYQKIFNWHQSAANIPSSQPSRMSCEKLIILDAALSSTEAGGLLDNGTVPSGATVLVDVMAGTGVTGITGNVVLVDVTPVRPYQLAP